MWTPWRIDGLARLGQLAVAAGLGGQVDDHGAGAHRLDHVGGDQDRRGPAGDERGGDDDVGVGDVLGQRAPARGGGSPRRAPWRSRRAVSASSSGSSISRNFAPRLSTCSLTTGRTSNARHDRAEPAGGGDGLQAGHAGAQDQHLGRRRRCRRRSSAAGRSAGARSRPGAPRGSRRRWPARTARPSTGPA